MPKHSNGRFGKAAFRRPQRWFFAALALLLILSLPSPAADIPCSWTGVERVVAIGDIHGDYDRFIFILSNPNVRIVDKELRWAAGKAHLVQLGDIMDRGPDAKRIFDLLMRLEEEAEAAGGMVHVLIGNHEEMNITGVALDYPEYVPPEQFLSFLPDDVRKAREKAFIAKLTNDRRRAIEAEGLDLEYDEVLRAYWQRIIRTDREARSAYVNHFNDTYGNWLMQKNVVIKINDAMYAHGGVNEDLSTWPLREINALMRKELRQIQDMIKNPQRYLRPFKPKLVYASDGPTWYRGLATKDENAAQEEVDRILDNLGAKAIVVGHSYSRSFGASPIVTLEHVSRFQGKVFVIDTGIAEIYGGVPSAMILENGEFTLWGETEEVAARSSSPFVAPEPPTSPKAVEEFLKTAVVMSHRNSMAGRTEPWRLTLEKDGVTRRAIFKYIDRRRPHPLPDSYQYELAAYALSKHLGLTFVPPVVRREIEGLPGSLQAFVENAATLRDMKEQNLAPGDPAAFERDIEDLRIFEILVYDRCDNDQDTFIGRTDQKIHRVDFSEAFGPTKGLPPGCEVRRCSKELFQRLLKWDEKAVADILKPYLNKEEIEALHSRRELIIRHLKKLTQARGEAAVLL